MRRTTQRFRAWWGGAMRGGTPMGGSGLTGAPLRVLWGTKLNGGYSYMI
jgi:hypothetical protein